jgi:hypothetical protein
MIIGPQFHFAGEWEEPRMGSPKLKPQPKPRPRLNQMTDEQLLAMRMCDLPVSLESGPLARRIARLYRELEARHLRFRPHIWIGEEWFTPDGVPGFAIPFFLAHPRLMKLERRQMLEVEGGTSTDCLRIMRHETGHAIDNAYGFHLRRQYRELFGSFARPYPDSYTPKPRSRNYVLHLDAWYAQAHPAEDFAETFAVWLTSRAQWRREYAGWPALRKLEFIDAAVGEVAATAAPNRRRGEVEPISALRLTLREHYERKRAKYSFRWPSNFDRQLQRVFTGATRNTTLPTAGSFLRRHRAELRHEVASGTGVHHYTVDQVLKLIIDRARGLKLRAQGSERQIKQKALILLAVQTMNVVHSGYQRIAI